MCYRDIENSHRRSILPHGNVSCDAVGFLTTRENPGVVLARTGNYSSSFYQCFAVYDSSHFESTHGHARAPISS